VFPDGQTITPVALGSDYDREVVPVLGLYLDHRWNPPWPHAKIYWPDFGIPADREELRRVLLQLLDLAKVGEPVELGCFGGHGGTGTALACLAVLTGVAPDDAGVWVRTNYCPEAVETDEQKAFVLAFA
jgi:protein-tyrosine phosphatase